MMPYIIKPWYGIGVRSPTHVRPSFKPTILLTGSTTNAGAAIRTYNTLEL